MKIAAILLSLLLLISCSKNNDSSTITDDTTGTTVENTTPKEIVVEAKSTNLPYRFGAETIFFKGYYWFMGGNSTSIDTGGLGSLNHIPLLNDIWKSKDGLKWTKVTEHAQWGGRSNFNLIKFKGALWLIGGDSNRDPQGNPYYSTAPGYMWNGEKSKLNYWKRDIWKSNNGTDWTEVVAEAPWQVRLDASVAVFNNKMYLIGGHSETNWHLYNDIWESENGINWNKIGEIPKSILLNPEDNQRRGIKGEGLVSYKGAFYLFGGAISSNDDSFMKVLKSTNGKDWNVVSTSTPWPTNHPDARTHARPFVFGDKMAICVSSSQSGIVTSILYITENGIDWEEKTMPIYTDNKGKFKYPWTMPRTIVNGNTAYMYGSVFAIWSGALIYPPIEKKTQVVSLTLQ